MFLHKLCASLLNIIACMNFWPAGITDTNSVMTRQILRPAYFAVVTFKSQIISECLQKQINSVLLYTFQASFLLVKTTSRQLACVAMIQLKRHVKLSRPRRRLTFPIPFILRVITLLSMTYAMPIE